MEIRSFGDFEINYRLNQKLIESDFNNELNIFKAHMMDYFTMLHSIAQYIQEHEQGEISKEEGLMYLKMASNFSTLYASYKLLQMSLDSQFLLLCRSAFENIHNIFLISLNDEDSIKYVELQNKEASLKQYRDNSLMPWQIRRKLYRNKTRALHDDLFGKLSKYIHGSAKFRLGDFVYNKDGTREAIKLMFILLHGSILATWMGFQKVVFQDVSGQLDQALHDIAIELKGDPPIIPDNEKVKGLLSVEFIEDYYKD